MKKRKDITKEKLQQMIVENLKTQRETAKHFGVSEACISKKMKEFGIPVDKIERYFHRKFGKLTPLKRVGKDKFGHAILECVCDCGSKINVRNDSLKSGNTQSCGCQRKTGENHGNYKGYKKLRSQHWSSILHGAKRRNLEVKITIEEAWEQYEKQDGKCALTGRDIFFAKTNKTITQSTASLDRIDPSKGYTKENIQWVHKKVNQMKWDLQQFDFIQICKEVVKNESNKRRL
jgi:hypothetical protein